MTPEKSPNIETLFFRIKSILNLSDKKIFSLKRKMAKQKPWEPVIVSDNLTWGEFSRINLFLHELQGVEPIVSVARRYPNPSTAHLVGYVSEVSAKDLKQKKYLRDMAVTGIAAGKTGLENKLDKRKLKIAHETFNFFETTDLNTKLFILFNFFYNCYIFQI